MHTHLSTHTQIRDLLCQSRPRILYSTYEVYATPALLGALAAAAPLRMGCCSRNRMAARFLGIFVTVFARAVAWNMQVRHTYIYSIYMICRT